MDPGNVKFAQILHRNLNLAECVRSIASFLKTNYRGQACFYLLYLTPSRGFTLHRDLVEIAMYVFIKK